jgi:hypothetical protein
MRRTLIDRAHDRSWVTITGMLEDRVLPPGCDMDAAASSSISAAHAWARVCGALAEGTCTSHNFRRLQAVRQIVETLGPVDGRYFAGLVRKWESALLGDETVLKIDGWGNPLRWPRVLLGTPVPYSPTTLRYLAHALWLKREGLVKPNGRIIEIGVGFGGLAAMNAVVSKATTLLVDLPQVKQVAAKMLNTTGFDGLYKTCDHAPEFNNKDYCVVSNYAFTELTAELQDQYLERYLRAAPRGVIISNAKVFAKLIGGRSDDELVAWLQREGLPATLDTTCEILCPSDHCHQVGLIRWSLDDR